MRLKTGIDEEMNPVCRNRSFRIVKHTATHEELFELAELPASSNATILPHESYG
jgi:hypothetical protein